MELIKSEIIRTKNLVISLSSVGIHERIESEGAPSTSEIFLRVSKSYESPLTPRYEYLHIGLLFLCGLLYKAYVVL